MDGLDAVEVAQSSMGFTVKSSGAPLQTGGLVPPFHWALVLDTGSSGIELVASRQKLLEFMGTVADILVSAAEAEHQNGYHQQPEYGCPLCEDETRGHEAG
jgi:hypothetical protein